METWLPTVGVVAALGLAPAITLRFIGHQQLDQARDVWLLGLAWVGAVLVLRVEPALGVMLVAVAARWRSWESLPAVLTWWGLTATWFLVGALPAPATAWVPVAWRITMAALLVFAVWQRRRRTEVKATVGTRIMLAALVVLVWPFTAWWEWPLYAYVLWRTSSWVALAGLGVAVAVRYPVTLPAVAVVLGAVAVALAVPAVGRYTVAHTPRGASLDGLVVRVRTWRTMLRLLRRWPIWLVGLGPTAATRQGPSLDRDLAREAARQSAEAGADRPMVGTPTHCEPLEHVYQYGLVGALALALGVWRVAPHLAWGDPWSASVAAGAVISLASIPARVAPVGLVWFTGLTVVAARP